MTALLLVDIQNDFLPGGTLAIRHGDQILPIVNRLIEKKFDFIVATQDWHPKNHGSFAANHYKQPGDRILLNGLEQILWPVHCVQMTPGAELASQLNSSRIDKIFFKGTDPGIDSYSSFFDNGHKKSTGLAEYLKENKVHDIYIAGLATDYCVKYSALDAAHLGFNVFVIEDACRGVNLEPNDINDALGEIKKAGIKIISSDDIGTVKKLERM